MRFKLETFRSFMKKWVIIGMKKNALDLEQVEQTKKISKHSSRHWVVVQNKQSIK